jgi:hypothetical protein
MTSQKITSLMIKALRELKQVGYNPITITWKESRDRETATFGFTEADTWGNGLYGEIRLSSRAVEHIERTISISKPSEKRPFYTLTTLDMGASSMENRKAWDALEKLKTVLEKNELLDSELRSYLWDLENYINICELSIYERYELAKFALKRLKKGE